MQAGGEGLGDWAGRRLTMEMAHQKSVQSKFLHPTIRHRVAKRKAMTAVATAYFVHSSI